METLTIQQLQDFYNKHKDRVDYLKQYKKDYYNTQVGRTKQQAASLRWYWRRKKQEYHPVWNPEPELYVNQ